MKNRHTSLQIIRTSVEIGKQELLGWFAIDILSQSDDDDPTKIQNGVLKIKFARLNGDGISKHFGVLLDGKLVFLGETKR